MTEKNDIVPGAISTDVHRALVTRSSVPAGLKYGEYKHYLRDDFFYSCAYCTISEAEAHAIRFTIDHYEPKKVQPKLENEYSNLMYSCDTCNTLKGDRTPTNEARANNIRFFRVDDDVYDEHFAWSGIRLNSKTPVGDFSIEALDLNRQSLRRLRDIRSRLFACDSQVLGGILALRRFHIDQLPQNIKGRAVRAINQTIDAADDIAHGIDDLLKFNARSPLIDEDVDVEKRSKERASKLASLRRLYPGNWRTPKK